MKLTPMKKPHLQISDFLFLVQDLGCGSRCIGAGKSRPDVRRRGLRGPLRLYGFNERLLLVLEIAAFLAVGGFLELTAREIEAV